MKIVKVRCPGCKALIVEHLNGEIRFRCSRCKHKFHIEYTPSVRKVVSMAMTT